MPRSDLSYRDAPAAVRDDLVESHRRFWDRLARPGAWWTSEERLAIARAVRAAYDCDLCSRRKETLLFDGVEGSHESTGELPESVVDAIHRIATDPARLSRDWFEGVLGQGVTAGQYIEILGTLVALISIDRFGEAIGVAHRELPAPGVGEPSGYRPANVELEDAWVPMIRGDGNDPPDDDLWLRGRVGNVIRAMSLVPDEVRTLNDLGAAHYMPNSMVLDVSQSPDRAIDRAQIELVAARVSALNECFF